MDDCDDMGNTIQYILLHSSGSVWPTRSTILHSNPDPSHLHHLRLRLRIIIHTCLQVRRPNLTLNRNTIPVPPPRRTVPRDIAWRPRLLLLLPLSNHLIISRRRQHRRPSNHRRRHNSLPMQQIRIRSHAAPPSPIRWRRIGYVVRRFVPAAPCLLERDGGCGTSFSTVWPHYFVRGHVHGDWCWWDEGCCVGCDGCWGTTVVRAVSVAAVMMPMSMSCR